MTDNTFESLFESLDETELQTLVNAGVNIDAPATHSEKKRLYHLTKKDTEPVRRLPKGRTVKTVLLAAALLTAFVLVAGAVAHFILPATIPEHIEGFTLQAVDPVVIEQDGKSVPVTATSDGCQITLEAIVKGDVLNRDLFTGEEVKNEKTYAVVTIKPDDAALYEEWQTGKKGEPVSIWMVEGYAPLCMSGYGCNWFIDGVVYHLADVTDAALFADRELYLAVSVNTPDWSVLRMDEQGKFYYLDRTVGMRAILPLPLDTNKADRAKADRYASEHSFITEPDYSWYDEQNALDDTFIASGVDLTPYIGDNEWRGSSPLQFGVVEHAREWLALSEERPADGVIPASFLYDYALENNAAPTQSELLEDAEAHAFENGDQWYYVGSDGFLLYPADEAVARLVVVKPGGIVIDVEADFNALVNRLLAEKASHAPGGYAAELYLLGGYAFNRFDWYTEEMYDSDVYFYRDACDARFAIIGEYWSCNGTVQVIL